MGSFALHAATARFVDMKKLKLLAFLAAVTVATVTGSILLGGCDACQFDDPISQAICKAPGPQQ
jgi:hypothetical protein